MLDLRQPNGAPPPVQSLLADNAEHVAACCRIEEAKP
jgi:hypothetical protein